MSSQVLISLDPLKIKFDNVDNIPYNCYTFYMNNNRRQDSKQYQGLLSRGQREWLTRYTTSITLGVAVCSLTVSGLLLHWSGKEQAARLVGLAAVPCMYLFFIYTLMAFLVSNPPGGRR